VQFFTMQTEGRSMNNGAHAKATNPMPVVRLLGCCAACVLLLLSGCHGLITTKPVLERAPEPPKPAASAPATAPPAQTRRGGGYYQDDGPGDNAPVDLAAIPDAEPKVEPLHRFANNPYTVFGQDYRPARELRSFRQAGIGSWYGRKFHGQRTSSGEPYDMYAMTAAHPTLPIPSYARVTSVATQKSVIVRVNDRGPFHSGRIIDLSYTAAAKLGYVNQGSTQLEIEQILPQDMPAIIAKQRSQAPATTVAAAPEQKPVETRVAEARPAPARPAEPAARPAPPPVQQVSAPAQIPVDAEKGGVFLQLGAFSGRDNAENFRVRVYQQLAWLDKAVEIYQREGLFRLHLGPYRDRAEANAAAEQIRETLAFKPVVIQR
jgi:rare lipoprotein A